MNEFIEQFLIESRENVEEATRDLLALEKSPGDREKIDSVFRAFHTLKGGAGIVDFFAMAQAVHAAEDVLAAARAGASAITAGLIDDCLTCLDQVVQWLDSMQESGELPAGADVQSSAIVARFARRADSAIEAAPPPAARAATQWVDALLKKFPHVRDQAMTAVRYAPDPDCFFRGEDPLAHIGAMPGLLALDVAPAAPWPPLDALDPFACNLIVYALLQSAHAEVVTALGEAISQCEVAALARAEATGGGALQMPAQARDVLAAQIALLAETGAVGVAGRIASAGITAANVLRHIGRSADADRIGQISSRSVRENAPQLLRDVVAALLNETAAPAAAPARHDVAARTLRVDAARIDALVNLTGELTVAKNAIGHTAKVAQDESNALAGVLKDRHAVLDRLIGELQRTVLAMRVLPLRHVFQRFPRLMREMAAALGKPADLIIEGDDTEADKAIVEMLFEPLMHVLRNAMDHGIEDGATRAAQGKPPVATVRMRALREGEHVLVEVIDDGAGINVARVRQVALERNVAPPETLAAMSEAEVIDLIFAPGFSTAAAVTDLSGRGVGMDAVRTAVQRMAGHVGVESRDGHGSTVRFTLPFSVMMTRVMTVEAGGELFGIPLDAIVETVRVAAASISPIGAAHAIVLRNRTIPLVELASALGVNRNERRDAEAIVVVAKIDGHFGALRVDRIGEPMDVMLKPLDGLLAGMRGIAGSTLLGDGSVLLVLDLAEVLQ